MHSNFSDDNKFLSYNKSINRIRLDQNQGNILDLSTNRFASTENRSYDENSHGNDVSVVTLNWNV